MATEGNVARDEGQILRVFCSRGPEDFLIHIDPAWAPRLVRQCVDEHWEGTAQLDFEELERAMQRAGLSYHSHTTANGSVELEASGEAAVVMGRWLASMFTSGVR
jgi:hypothetical protein